jgi:hypothetical protein
LRIFSLNFFRKENDKSENFPINPINTYLVDLRYFSITGKVNLGLDRCRQPSRIGRSGASIAGRHDLNLLHFHPYLAGGVL